MGMMREATESQPPCAQGRPARRPFTYDELQGQFDYLDERVERLAGSGRMGARAALRDAQMINTAHAFGLAAAIP
jgi:integrase/recombinase XerC